MPGKLSHPLRYRRTHDPPDALPRAHIRRHSSLRGPVTPPPPSALRNRRTPIEGRPARARQRESRPTLLRTLMPTPRPVRRQSQKRTERSLFASRAATAGWPPRRCATTASSPICSTASTRSGLRPIPLGVTRRVRVRPVAPVVMLDGDELSTLRMLQAAGMAPQNRHVARHPSARSTAGLVAVS